MTMATSMAMAKTKMMMMRMVMRRRATIALQVSPGRCLPCVRTARAETLTLSAFM